MRPHVLLPHPLGVRLIQPGPSLARTAVPRTGSDVGDNRDRQFAWFLVAVVQAAAVDHHLTAFWALVELVPEHLVLVDDYPCLAVRADEPDGHAVYTAEPAHLIHVIGHDLHDVGSPDRSIVNPGHTGLWGGLLGGKDCIHLSQREAGARCLWVGLALSAIGQTAHHVHSSHSSGPGASWW